jgi:hypothetical protein
LSTMPELGLCPNIPLKKAGILGTDIKNFSINPAPYYTDPPPPWAHRMEPPTSEPMPQGEPAAPMSAPSPPDDPPAVRPVW